MFHESGIPYLNVTKLIETWFSSGLIGVSGLVCRDCTGPKPKRRGKSDGTTSKDIVEIQSPGIFTASVHCLRVFDTRPS